MAIKFGKFYITRHDPRELLQMLAEKEKEILNKENEILKLKEKLDRKNGKKCKRVIDVINKIANEEKTPEFTLSDDNPRYDRKVRCFYHKGELRELNEYGKELITDIPITKEMLNKEIIILDGSDKE